MSTPAPVPSQASPRIFVSHSHADDAFGLRLVSDLRARLGEDAVWYDSSGGLHGGDEWWNHIVAELTARNTFIAIFSPDSVVSKWVIDEVNIAWALRHSIGTRIIPILARPCEQTGSSCNMSPSLPPVPMRRPSPNCWECWGSPVNR